MTLNPSQPVTQGSGCAAHAQATRGLVTPELRRELAAHKADLLPVLARLQAMRALAGQTPHVS